MQTILPREAHKTVYGNISAEGSIVYAIEKILNAALQRYISSLFFSPFIDVTNESPSSPLYYTLIDKKLCVFLIFFH